MRPSGHRPAPAVSIVLTTYNRASLLQLALDSTLAQDYRDLEVLVMNDGSTDETDEVLAAYARRLPPERFRFESGTNMGQARTLNRGYEIARGELLGYLSDDDVIAPGLVSALVGALAERPEASAAYPAYRLIDAQGSVVDTWLPFRYTPTAALTRHDTIIGPGGLARRTALEASGGWDPSYRWMGDLIMWMGVGRAGPVVRVAEPLASWRKHPEGATSTTGIERAAEHLRVFEHGLKLDPATAADPTLRAEALRNACVTATYFAQHMHFGPGEPLALIDQDRPLVSAAGSGQDPATPRFDLEQAERVAAAMRSLGELTLRLAEARDLEPNPRPPSGGYERAIEGLRAVGAITPSDGPGVPFDGPAFGPALVSAFLDCATDVPSAGQRFLAPDRRQCALVRDELRALEALHLAARGRGRGIVEAVRDEIGRRQEDLARAQATVS